MKWLISVGAGLFCSGFGMAIGASLWEQLCMTTGVILIAIFFEMAISGRDRERT